MKRIVITTRWYAPEKTPRAFRAKEIVEELIERGYDIELISPVGTLTNKMVDLHKISIKRNRLLSVSEVKGNYEKYREIIKKVFIYFIGDSPYNVLYAMRIVKYLYSNKKEREVFLSIGLPFYVHVAVALFLWRKKSSAVAIADCGDPFYANPSFKKVFYLKYLEKWVFSKFDFVTIPIEAAQSSYLDSVSAERIKVIPQGFRLIDIPKDAYQKNIIPTFGYAGVFYESIRNPRYFFEYLLSVENNFRFVVYANANGFTSLILAEYKEKLGDKLDVREAIDREKLIPEMATWEFVINFDNDNSNQRPSKLIDYAMSKRPILSFNQATFKPEVFTAFLHGDYSEQEHIDLSQYDIRTVVDKFEELFQKDKARGSRS